MASAKRKSINSEGKQDPIETKNESVFQQKDLNKMEANDRMLRLAGDFGKCQLMLIFLFSFINILSAWHYYSQTIISITPEHSCIELEAANVTEQTVQEYLPTFENLDTLVSLDIINNVLQNETYTDENQTIAEVLKDFGFAGMVAELNWVCDNSWKPVLGQSLFFFGSVLGTLVFGILADIFGRLPMLVASNILAAGGNVATSFISGDEVSAFAACRFVSGMATDSNFVMMYIIVMEYLSPERRTLGLNLTIGIFYCIGTMSAPWIAVICSDWRTFLRATSAPLICIIVYWFLVPESAQWLLSIRKVDKAVQCFKRIAKYNGKTIDESHINAFKKIYEDKTIIPRNSKENIHRISKSSANNKAQNKTKDSLHQNSDIQTDFRNDRNRISFHVPDIINKTNDVNVKDESSDITEESFEISFEEIDLNNFQNSYEDNFGFVHDSSDSSFNNTICDNICSSDISKNKSIANAHMGKSVCSKHKDIDESNKPDLIKPEKVRKANFFGLLRTPHLRKITLILLFKSMVLTLCYDAMSRNIENLGIHPFIIFTLSSSAILPACIILLFIQDKLGRKATASGALLLSGIFTAGCGALLASETFKGSASVASAITLSILGRLWVTVAYNSGAQYAAELIPTEVRGQGVAVAHVAGYAATFFSAYILYTGRLFPAFPSLILGTLSIICGLCCLFLPETLGRHLPSTLEEGEEFGKDEHPLDFVLWSFNRARRAETTKESS